MKNYYYVMDGELNAGMEPFAQRARYETIEDLIEGIKAFQRLIPYGNEYVFKQNVFACSRYTQTKIEIRIGISISSFYVPEAFTNLFRGKLQRILLDFEDYEK